MTDLEGEGSLRGVSLPVLDLVLLLLLLLLGGLRLGGGLESDLAGDGGFDPRFFA